MCRHLMKLSIAFPNSPRSLNRWECSHPQPQRHTEPGRYARKQKKPLVVFLVSCNACFRSRFPMFSPFFPVFFSCSSLQSSKKSGPGKKLVSLVMHMLLCKSCNNAKRYIEYTYSVSLHGSLDSIKSYSRRFSRSVDAVTNEWRVSIYLLD